MSSRSGPRAPAARVTSQMSSSRGDKPCPAVGLLAVSLGSGAAQGTEHRASAAEEPRFQQTRPLHSGVRADTAQTAGCRGKLAGGRPRPPAGPAPATGLSGGALSHRPKWAGALGLAEVSANRGSRPWGPGGPRKEKQTVTHLPPSASHICVAPSALGKAAGQGRPGGPRGGLRGLGPHTALPQGTWPWWPLRSGFLTSLEVKGLMWRLSGSPVTS